MAAHSRIFAENLRDRGAWRATVHGISKELDMTEATEYLICVSDVLFRGLSCPSLLGVPVLQKSWRSFPQNYCG